MHITPTMKPSVIVGTIAVLRLGSRVFQRNR